MWRECAGESEVSGQCHSLEDDQGYMVGVGWGDVGGVECGGCKQDGLEPKGMMEWDGWHPQGKECGTDRIRWRERWDGTARDDLLVAKFLDRVVEAFRPFQLR